MNMTHPFTLVIGLGKTGFSIARYLQRKNIPFKVYDTRQKHDGLIQFKKDFPGVDVFLGHVPEDCFQHISEIISSPGVSLDAPVVRKARELHIPIYGDIECLARELNERAPTTPIISITGTNGKSTVTTLVGEMIKAAHMPVIVAGNIGMPVLDQLIHFKNEIWVLELSSFQLDLTNALTPTAAVILNVSPDHLDRHGSLDAYLKAKQRVYHHAKVKMYNRDDLATKPCTEADGARVLSYGLNTPNEGEWGLVTENNQRFLAWGSRKLCAVDDIKIKGLHNWSNALAACALANEVGVSLECMVEVLKQFSGLPHRTQWVRTLKGVDWINDSKGTNIGATYSAITGIGGAMLGKIVLIAGGQGKGANFAELTEPMREHVKTLILMGEDADKMENALGSIVPVKRANSLEEAVSIAHRHAEPGDVVMLSPACASWDMFKDFNHRGEVFRKAVEEL